MFQTETLTIRMGQETDMELKASIYRALYEDAVLEYYKIGVYVKNGTVSLNGHITSTTSLSRIDTILQSMPGIVGIKNNLVLDDKLTREVALSLSALEHRYGCKFFVDASHGVISLDGIVSDENVKLLAEQCVAANQQVRGVLNQVRVTGIEPALQAPPFLQPAIGAIIYFVDGVFGIITQVIINPDNRCVIQVIIQGQLSEQKQNLMALTNNQAEILEKTVIIPVNLIRYLTVKSGFLTIKSTETTCYEDFNPLYFTAPSIDWSPPYPYGPNDVLFAVEARELENQIMRNPDIEPLNAWAQPASAWQARTPIDSVAAWEDDGGQIIQIAETLS